MITNFIIALNSVNAYNAPATPPPDTDDNFYVSVTGSGDGLSLGNPMSVGDYEALVLTDNSTILFKAGDEL